MVSLVKGVRLVGTVSVSDRDGNHVGTAKVEELKSGRRIVRINASEAPDIILRGFSLGEEVEG